LADLIAGNQREALREMPWFGQDLFERAQHKPSLTDPGYRAARAHCLEHARTHGLDALFQRHRLQALIYPTNPPAWTVDLLNGDHILGGNTSFAAVSGYPSITVPMGATRGLPVGLSFTGPAWSEAALLRIAYAFEQQSQARIEPRFLPTMPVA
jgi:amidase